ncbi:hypothetical protein M997_0773 [Proteus hauseri ATCC 700826]|uniref:Uncharacterized protein n=1 Tax=Proteus hauseri ATCC 700826 TaxID=1354271 RepID=A0AAJ3HU35_PROHU|nr:hypothetical protein [Proteus hauseri]OAT49088.1 hypothetical protein M997_0773 [Proteus hauseri ATCC 700826]
MLTIPFSLFGLTDWILSFDAAVSIIMFATFGVLFSLFIILPLMSITPLKKYTMQVTGALFSSIFISLMILISLHLVLGVNSSIKLLLVWWVILFSSLIFWFVNFKYIKEVTGNKFSQIKEKAQELEAKKKKK